MIEGSSPLSMKRGSLDQGSGPGPEPAANKCLVMGGLPVTALYLASSSTLSDGFYEG